MYEQILVPLDGSQMSEVALDHAVEIARVNKSHIILFEALSPVDVATPVSAMVDGEATSTFGFDTSRVEAEQAGAEEYLTSLARKLATERLIASVVVSIGDPATEILRHAASAGASLIVMSTHRKGGRSNSGFGHTAENVLRGAHVPLMIIPRA